jgi:hypothetical protein
MNGLYVVMMTMMMVMMTVGAGACYRPAPRADGEDGEWERDLRPRQLWPHFRVVP